MICLGMPKGAASASSEATADPKVHCCQLPVHMTRIFLFNEQNATGLAAANHPRDRHIFLINIRNEFLRRLQHNVRRHLKERRLNIYIYTQIYIYIEEIIPSIGKGTRIVFQLELRYYYFIIFFTFKTLKLTKYT